MRTWEDVSKVAYKAAHDVKVNGFEIDELVNESYMSKWQTCKEHEIYKTLRNSMLDAIRAEVGQGTGDNMDARKKAKTEEVKIDNHSDECNDKFSFEEKGHLQLENEDMVKKLLKCLDPDELLVVSKRIYKEETYEFIADNNGFASKGHVHDIWERAIKKLKGLDLIKDLG